MVIKCFWEQGQQRLKCQISKCFDDPPLKTKNKSKENIFLISSPYHLHFYGQNQRYGCYFNQSGDTWHFSEICPSKWTERWSKSFICSSFFSTLQRLLSGTQPLNGSITETLFVFFCAADSTCLYVQAWPNCRPK